MRNLHISYVATGEGRCIVGEKDEALIPVSNPRILRRMFEIARLHGIKISRTHSFRVAAEPIAVHPNSAGLVVAISQQLMPAAALYAHLTGRAVALMRPYQPLLGDCEVVFLCGTEWTSAVADWLEAEAAIRPNGLGIILSPSVDLADEMAICNAVAFAAKPAPVPRHMTMVIGDLPLTLKDDNSIRLVGAKADPAIVRHALSDVNDLVVLQAHGDGYDAKLGDTAILCAYDPTARAHAGGATAACLVRQCCHRLGHRDLKDAWQTGRLVSTRGLRGRVIALDVCSVMPVGSRSVRAAASLGASILMNGCFGALVASPEVHIMTADALSGLIDVLGSEPRIGRAVATINESSAAKQVGRSLFLFGDPRYGGENASPLTNIVYD